MQTERAGPILLKPGLPLVTIALVDFGCVVLTSGGRYVRRGCIRQQNKDAVRGVLRKI